MLVHSVAGVSFVFCAHCLSISVCAAPLPLCEVCPRLLSASLSSTVAFEIAFHTSLHLQPHRLRDRQGAMTPTTTTITLWHESQSQNSHPQPPKSSSHLVFPSLDLTLNLFPPPPPSPLPQGDSWGAMDGRRKRGRHMRIQGEVRLDNWEEGSVRERKGKTVMAKERTLRRQQPKEIERVEKEERKCNREV